MPDEPINEWIARVLPLRPGGEARRGEAASAEVARFRLRIVAPHERPGRRVPSPRFGAMDIGPVRLLCLDSANPHGGAVGGSLDSAQCAWLVRSLEAARNRYVVVASHDGSTTMTSEAGPDGAAPRVLGPEVVSILLAHPQVIAWISGTLHDRAGRRHGDPAHGFWELPGAANGVGAPLAGGLSVTAQARHLHRVVSLHGALAGPTPRAWELPDPLPSVSEEALAVAAAARG